MFQAQADRYRTQGLGLSANDLPGFYAWCQEPANKAATQNAIQQQVYSNQMGAWNGLVSKYMSNTAPSVESLQRQGMETKKGHNGEDLVLIQDQWMPVTVQQRRA